MLSKQKALEISKYWIDGAKESYKTMQYLYDGKRYSDCLFFGHLMLEKILKAVFVNKKTDIAPYIHNLYRLAELINLKLEKDEILLLKEVSGFNLEARYPDEKYSFYKLCTKKFTDNYFQAIINFYKKTCLIIK